MDKVEYYYNFSNDLFYRIKDEGSQVFYPHRGWTWACLDAELLREFNKAYPLTEQQAREILPEAFKS